MNNRRPRTGSDTGSVARLPWLCGTAVALAVLLLIGLSAFGRDQAFTVRGEYHGVGFTLDFSGAENPSEVLDELLTGDASKRRYIVGALRERGFLQVIDTRLSAELAELPPRHETARSLRELLAELKGPFDEEVALAPADASFVEAIYELGREHPLPRRLRTDSLGSADVSQPRSRRVEVRPAPDLEDGQIRVCQSYPAPIHEAQLYRWETGNTVRTVVGLVRTSPCRTSEHIAVSRADWRRLGGAAEAEGFLDAEVRPVRRGTFGLAQAYADALRFEGGGATP